MTELSIIIVTYNNLEIVVDCLNSIEKFNDIDDRIQVIVVDNSTTNNLYDYINQHYPSVNCIRNENKGFGHGNNIGVSVAKGDNLLFLNPDTILIEPIFKFSLEKFNNNANLALFGMKLVSKNLSSNLSFFYIDKKNVYANILIKICNLFNLYNYRTMFISGANIFIRKAVFYEIGMFDENYFMYCEDKDLSKSVVNAGYRTEFIKEKKIIHLEGGSTSNNLVSYERSLTSEKYYHRKYNKDFIKFVKKERNLLKIKYYIYSILNTCKNKEIEDKLNLLKKIAASDLDGSH